MKYTKKTLAFLLALVMCLSFVPMIVFADDEATIFDDVEGKLVIIHTNDVHGRDAATAFVYGTAAVSQLKKDFEAAGANVLLLSAGDAFFGQPLVNYDKGATAGNFLSAAGYDALAPGNHEFNWGVENLMDIVADADFITLSANVIFNDENEFDGEPGDPVFQANTIFVFGDLKVGVFGLTTPETYTKAHPSKVVGIDLLQEEEMFAAAQAQVDFLKAEGCDFIIALGHLGIDDETMGNRSLDVIEAVTGIDLFVDGHSHTTLANGRLEGDTLLVQAGTQLASIGYVVFDPADGDLEANLLRINGGVKDYLGLDEELNAVIEARRILIETTLKAEIIGITESLLFGRQPQIRNSETNLGNFATDALLWAANQVYGEGFADAALTNGGGIRDSIPHINDAVFPYEITMFDMVTVFPFGNLVEVIEITGAQLLEALEAALFVNPAVSGAFPQISGIELTLYNYIPYARGAQYDRSTFFAPANPGQRVRDVKVGGQPLDLEKVYRIATNDFTAAGGDTYLIFKDKIDSYNTGVPLEEALINFLTEKLDGVAGAEYAAPRGLIKVVDVYPDINKTSWYFDAFSYIFEEKLIDGISDFVWAPNQNVDRGTVFEAFYRLAGSPEVEGENFPDVAADAFYYDAALWAKNEGISEGSGGNFQGNRLINRAELAAIFVRYLTILGVEFEPADLSAYPDVDDIPAWAVEQDVMAMIVSTEIITGSRVGEEVILDAGGPALRAQLAQMLLNMADFIENYEFEADEDEEEEEEAAAA